MTILLIEGFEGDRERVWAAASVSTPTTSYYLNTGPGFNDEGTSAILSFDGYLLATVTPANGEWRKLSFAVFGEGPEGKSQPTGVTWTAGFSDNSDNVNLSYSDAYIYRDKATGAFGMRRSSSSSDDLLSAPGSCLEEQWYYVEYMHQRGTSGAAKLYVNGNLLIDAPAANNGGEPWTFSGIQGASANVGATTYQRAFFDDLIIEDFATEPGSVGPRKVYPLTINADSATAWTGSDGNSTDNYLLVTDGSDATYVESNAGSNEVDLYSHNTSVSGTVDAVRVDVKASMSEVGTDDFGIAVESNGTTTTAAKTLGTGDPGWQFHIQDTDPDGDVAWTSAKVNGATFGVTS